MMKKTSAAVSSLFAIVSLPVCADGYLPDILKDPTYLETWNKLIASEEHNETWLTRYSSGFNGPSVHSKRVSLSDGDHKIAWVCEAQNCGARKFVVLFAPGGQTACGALLKSGRVDKIFGTPTEERWSAMNKYIREGR